jgi:hypothetical protein
MWKGTGRKGVRRKRVKKAKVTKHLRGRSHMIGESVIRGMGKLENRKSGSWGV